MTSAENHIGRLIEVRTVPPFDASTLAATRKQVAEVVAATVANHGKVVLCLDITAVTMFPPETAEGIIAMMRSDNPVVDRAALLAKPGAVFAMQLERILREAGHAHRRVFRAEDSLCAWLDEVLTHEERVRMREFLKAAV